MPFLRLKGYDINNGVRLGMQTVVDGVNQCSVLVVDDDRTISRLIRYNLEDKSTQIFEAATGLECIRILREAVIDLIVLDIRLPDFSGWGILSLLRLTEALRRIPVIMVSVEPPDSAMVAQLRPDDYVQKPFDTRDLVVRIRKVIGSRPHAGGDDGIH